jgi:protein SCO1/2
VFAKILICLIAILLSMVAPFGSGHRVMAHDETSVEKADLEQKLDAQIPLDLVFRDESGRSTALQDYFDGRPVLLALVYYDCPQLCPLVLDGLVRSLRPLRLRAGSDYRVVAVSIDPRETTALARAKKRAVIGPYARADGAGWHFLTGEQGPIQKLAHAVGFRYAAQTSPAAKDRFIHAAGVMVVTPRGRISRYFYGFDYAPRDLRFALIEASENRIGSPIDHLLLLCYEYNPGAAKYTLSILRLLRISGSATVLALGGFLGFMFLRERRNPSAGPVRGRRR